MLKDLFSKQNSLKAATTILAVTLALSNVLGMVRDHFLAQKVTTDLLDTYYAAFRIPDLLFNIIILGSVSSAFIPVFSRFLANKDQEKAHKLASSVITIGMTCVVITSIAMYFVMPFLIPLLVPDFSSEKQQITLQLARLLLFSPIFFGLSYFFGAVLNSYKRFFVTSLAPLIYNISIIVATIGFADRYGTQAVGWGVVIGAFLHMAIQIFPVRHIGLRLRLVFDTSVDGLKEVGRLMIPRSIGLGALQILLFSFTAIASGLGGGSVAIFSLADNIQTLPTVIFGNSVALALFPTLSESYSLGKLNDFRGYIEKAVISILFFLIPASIAIIMLRIQIVRLVLGSGHFGWEQTILASQTLGFFALSLAFSGLLPLFARAFYALNNTLLPTIYSIGGVIVSIIMAFVLSQYLGVSGLALAFTIGSFVNCFLLYWGLRRRLPKFDESMIVGNLNKIFISTVAMALTIQLIKISIGTIYDLNRFFEVAVQAGLAIAIGSAVYFSMTYFLGFREFHFGKINQFFNLIGGIYAPKNK